MKYLLKILFLLIPFITHADDFPAKPNKLVTDYTSTLSGQEVQSLEQKLVAFNDTTSTQIAVVIMSSVGGYDISDYAIQLGNKWGIGQGSKNNGVLMLIAKDDRKVFIASGFGAEGALTDALCKRIINNEISPRFKQGNYYEGIDAATTAIMGIMSGEFTADQYMGKRKGGAPWFMILLVIIIVIIVFASRVSSVRKYSHMNGMGFWAAWALMNAASSRSHGSWGGFSGGSGFGGGSGGGFGGFGGGGFGGGGAGGSW